MKLLTLCNHHNMCRGTEHSENQITTSLYTRLSTPRAPATIYHLNW